MEEMIKEVPFDIKLAKRGVPVKTRGGHKARIICYDMNVPSGPTIVALIVNRKDDPEGKEIVDYFTQEGICKDNVRREGLCEKDPRLDLVMDVKPRKCYIIIYVRPGRLPQIVDAVYESRETAERQASTYVQGNGIAEIHEITYYN